MKTLARLSVCSALFMGALVLAPTAGCSEDEGSGTTGHRITLEVRAEASAKSKALFVNAAGWNVTLTKALIATGPLYFYDGEPLFARAERAAWIKSAFAHPGHYVPGNAKGELLTPSSADLLGATVAGQSASLGMGNGVSGFARSATFTFASPAAGPFAAELGSNVIVLEGSAAKEGESTRTFRVEIAPEEMRDAKGAMQIEGCPFAVVDMQVDGIVTVGVKLEMWFDHVDFADVAPSVDGKAVLLADGLARNQLVRGTKVGLAYPFAYAPKGRADE